MPEKKKNVSSFAEKMKEKFQSSYSAKKITWTLPNGEILEFYLRKLPVKELREIIDISKKDAEEGNIPIEKLNNVLTRSIVDENGERHLSDDETWIFDYAYTDDYNDLVTAFHELMSSEDDQKN